ncbi:MAG: dihydroorotase [Oscillospiraceae bacterium]|nr:dihydroorotase [Oscillospiraceae bacterium]
MKAVFRGGQVFQSDGHMAEQDVYVRGGGFVSTDADGGFSVYDAGSLSILPGFVDVHVHLREPGFSYKETIRTGTRAAARGGYTTVCTMPNLNPAPDCMEGLEAQMQIIRRSAVVRVVPYGSITRGEKGEMLSDMEPLAPCVAAFSDDGRGVQSREIMRQAMQKAGSLGKLIAAHCEDDTLLRGGYIHDGAYARAHGHRGICSASEWKQIARDLELVRETGCAYHVCHVSAKESVELLRDAKREGLDVSCETAPHYLLLDDSMLREDGRFKMNPPVRGKDDRLALLEAVRDGTIALIATDHAPHSAEEKSRGLKGSLMGIVGLETAFPLLYTYLVRPGVISFARLMELLNGAALRRFHLGAPLGAGHVADFSVWDLDAESIIDPAEFQSMGRATPFAGWPVNGRCRMTIAGGNLAWDDGTLRPV